MVRCVRCVRCGEEWHISDDILALTFEDVDGAKREVGLCGLKKKLKRRWSK
jgi:hypothetical protein